MNAEAGTGATASLRVLVVEDNVHNQSLMQRLLARQGHEVRVVEDGVKALEVLEREAFDLVLMDCRMPTMDGFTTTQAIRRMPAPAGSVPIVAVTASVTASDLEACRKSGMDEVLTKPVDLELFFRLLAKYAARKAGA